MITITVTKLEYDLILQALKVWRGDFPAYCTEGASVAYISKIWTSELTKLIDNISSITTLKYEEQKEEIKCGKS